MTDSPVAGTGGQDGQNGQTLAGVYGPLLDAVQKVLEEACGPLLWAPRTDAFDAVLPDGSHALRIGAIHADGVPTPDLDVPAIGDELRRVLTRWDFPQAADLTGSPSGHLVYESDDAQGARFRLQVRESVDAWVDQPSATVS